MGVGSEVGFGPIPLCHLWASDVESFTLMSPSCQPMSAVGQGECLAEESWQGARNSPSGVSATVPGTGLGLFSLPQELGLND